MTRTSSRRAPSTPFLRTATDNVRLLDVVCVDDSPLSAVLLQSVLEELIPVRVRTVHTAHEALEMAYAACLYPREVSRPDLWVIDHDLGTDQTGLELKLSLDELFGYGSTLEPSPWKAVLCTGHPANRHARQAQRAGFCDFWQKPLNRRFVRESLLRHFPERMPAGFPQARSRSTAL